MKKLSYLFSAAVLVAMLAAVGCSKDEGSASPQDIAGGNFQGTWTATAVTFDTEDRSADYSNFTLTVNYSAGQGGGSYSASGGPAGSSPWPASGTWEFDSATPAANNFTVTRNDGLSIVVSGLNETGMTMVFEFDDTANQTGRVNAVNGTWTFTMAK